MALTKFEKDMAIISALDDEPNDVGGLSASELKGKFDEGGLALKKFLNDTLLPEAEREFSTKEEVKQIVIGVLPDGTVTEEKLDPDLKDKIAGAVSANIHTIYNGG